MKEDSRVGLVFDGTTGSCASDLSDSSHQSFDWNENLDLEMDHGPLIDICNSLEHDEDIEVCRSNVPSNDQAAVTSFDRGHDGCLQNTPQTPSFRSRKPSVDGSPQSLQMGVDTSHSQKRVNRIRQPSIRFCMILFTSTFVLLSLIPHVTHSRTPTEELSEQLRREEVPFPLYAVPAKTALLQNQGKQQEGYDDKAKYSLSSDTLSQLSKSLAKQEMDKTIQTKQRHQPNIAMARSQEQRPVFGIVDSKVERFVLDESSHTRLGQERRGEAGNGLWRYNLGVWFGGALLVAGLFEGIHKKLYSRRWDDYLETHRSA